MGARVSLYNGWMRLTGRRPQLELCQEWLGKQFLPASESGRAHLESLCGILLHAFQHVAYYRDCLLRAGFDDNEIRNDPVAALGALPLLDKRILREHFEALKSDDLASRNWHVNTSGGSTGEPARFIQDSEYHLYGMAGKALFDVWTGYKAGEPRVILWGSERDLLVGRETVKARVGRFLRNEVPLNTFRMSEQDLRHFVDVINEVRPVQITAYVESAFELARYVEQRGLKIHSPTAILTSAGTLFPHMRELIEKVFQARVFNRYGSREVGDVACNCREQDGLHVNPYTHHVEILREDGTPCVPGEIGEVVVTSLTNRAMPLLRYRIGDLASWAEQACECGRAWPLMQEVAGRVNSILKTRNGTFATAALSTMMYFKDSEKTKPFSSFGRYQLVQKGLDHLVVRLLLENEALFAEEKPLLIHNIKAVFGNDIILDVETPTSLPSNPSGKHIYIWSEVE
ncbi:phenylacetate--CoA ligase family protein [Marinobacter sp. W-8]|uniref:phenylacetate--CoA ligase family protein n=1 Tax=Marinobacter sp. W-8 TaxID=3369658 RepID=UPI0037C54951